MRERKESCKDRVIGVSVAPEVKEWVKEEAEKRKWTMSFFCHELLKEAMEREVRDDG